MPDNATDSPAHTPELSLPWKVVRPWATCASIHDASKKCILFGCLEDEPIYQEICRRVNSAPALFDALKALLARWDATLAHHPENAAKYPLVAAKHEAARAALAAATGSTPRSEA